MILPDVNLLIYAVDSTSAFHAPARAWWDARLSGTTVVGLAYPCILGFLRLTTSPAVFTTPITPAAATGIVQRWLDQPCTTVVQAGERHWPILRRLIDGLGVAGGLTTDAHLAALAIEHGFTLCSNDADFSRFPGLSVENPLADR